MIRSEKKLAALKKVLKSGKSSEIERHILSLREDEPFEGALILLASFYDETDNESIRLKISELFNDLKENSAKVEVIEALLSSYKSETMTMLAASCWQSGLDYAMHASEIIKAYLKGDYNTSLECFTVLDVCSAMIPQKEKKTIIEILEREIEEQEELKKHLTAELISLLKV